MEVPELLRKGRPRPSLSVDLFVNERVSPSFRLPVLAEIGLQRVSLSFREPALA